jgi:hypothetical protein
MAQTTAKIIKDTINSWGARITTFEINAPRFLLAEINTHRVIAKSAASSRAIPIKKRIAMIRDAPFVPSTFGKNRAGMQATEELVDNDAAEAKAIWLASADTAVLYACELESVGVHKQQANRILEPFAYFQGVLTATEWDNFFRLRNHKDAQPEFQELASIIQTHYEESKPTLGEVHLPYSEDIPHGTELRTAMRISAARCARVSYKTFSGTTSTPEEDIDLCDKLIEAGHMSPFDHVAISDSALPRDGMYVWSAPKDQRHFWGWIPHRVQIEAEKGWTCARNSYDPF